MMNLDKFKSSVIQDYPPEKIRKELKALWWDAKGNWNKAHRIIQALGSLVLPAWIHAYLHRKEGDLGNASYWYTLAGRKMAEGSLDQEWESIVRSILEKEVN